VPDTLGRSHWPVHLPHPSPPRIPRFRNGALGTTVTPRRSSSPALISTSRPPQGNPPPCAVSVNRSGPTKRYCCLSLFAGGSTSRHRPPPGQNVNLLSDYRSIRLVMIVQAARSGNSTPSCHLSTYAANRALPHRPGNPSSFLWRHGECVLLLEGDEDPRPLDVWATDAAPSRIRVRPLTRRR